MESMQGEDTEPASMICRQAQQSLETFGWSRFQYPQKHWLECFSNERNLTEEEAETLSKVWFQFNAPGDLFDMLLDFEDPVASCDREKVKDHYAVEKAFLVSNHKVLARARIYDIQMPSGSLPGHSDWLDVAELRAALKNQVRTSWNHFGMLPC